MSDLADDPAAESLAGGRRRPRPRNYLEPREHRRLVWRILPASLAIVLTLSFIERSWRGPPPSGPRQVDTSLEAVRGPRPEGEAVIIEAPTDPPTDGPAVSARSAADTAFAAVRDDTFFREADMEAWRQTWETLRAARSTGIAAASAPRVSFAELFGQPRSFRGRLVRLRGTFHRVEYLAAPADTPGLEGYWQGWLEPSGGPASPIVVQFLDLPEGMPTGLRVDVPVDVTGYFFKRYAYQATDTVRVAPLVMALRPTWRPAAPAPAAGTSLAAWVAATCAALATVGFVGWLLARPAARPSPRTLDVAVSLDGIEPVSTGESLRRLAAGEADAAAVTGPSDPEDGNP